MSANFREQLRGALIGADENIVSKRAEKASQEKERLQAEVNAKKLQQQQEREKDLILRLQQTELKKMAELLINEGLPPRFKAKYSYHERTPWDRIEPLVPVFLAVLIENCFDPGGVEENNDVWVVKNSEKTIERYNSRTEDYSYTYCHEGVCLDRSGALWCYKTGTVAPLPPISTFQPLPLRVMSDEDKLAGCDLHDTTGPWKQAILESVELNR